MGKNWRTPSKEEHTRMYLDIMKALKEEKRRDPKLRLTEPAMRRIADDIFKSQQEYFDMHLTQMGGLLKSI